MRRSYVVACVLALVVAAAVPASAITGGGEPDGTDHPYVGLMDAYATDGSYLWSCSGALVSSDVYVTAGHCTQAPADLVRIWFDTDSWGAGWLTFTGWDVEGTPYTHPDYDPNAFFLFDLGVVTLDTPYTLSDYADLPTVGAIDDMGKGRKNNMVTAVGYGLNRIVDNPVKGPVHLEWDGLRRQAGLMIVNTKGVAGVGPFARAFEGAGSIALSGDAKHGGTCFGDSGGPILADTSDTIIAVTSFGNNGNCAGIGGAYRIDQTDDLDFINGFLP